MQRRPPEVSVVSPLLKRLITKRHLTEADIAVTIEATLQKTLDAIGAEAILYYRTIGKTTLLERAHYAPFIHAKDPVSMTQIEALQNRVIPWGRELADKAIAAHRSTAPSDCTSIRAVAERSGRDTSLTIPLCALGRALGALQVLNKISEEGFTQDDHRLIEEVAGYTDAFMARILDPEKKADQEVVADYISRLEGYPRLTAAQLKPEEALVREIGESAIQRLQILPLSRINETSLRVAMTNPLDVSSKDTFETTSHRFIKEVAVTTPKAIQEVLDHCLRGKVDVGEAAALVKNQYASTALEHVEVEEGASEESAPIIQLTNRIIEDAFKRGASDIHIEPFEDEIVVRIRIDGDLTPTLSLPLRAGPAVIARIKIMADLDITEKRLPQDGRIHFKHFNHDGVDLDLRVSTAPMAHGEKAVMRILDKNSTLLGLAQMGFSASNLECYRKLIRAPYGMILHVGPTGSGKTTTLYSALHEIKDPSLNIQTAENPIEYEIKGISQMQMQPKIGLTFANALRCFLRQDPDVILVGEIRDQETAKIAVEAALTGHLLFSTLHTNDAAGTITRLLEIGVEPFLISSSLLAVCAQRLIRRLCPACKEPFRPDTKVIAQVSAGWPEDITLFKPKGCPACRKTGYRGRLGIHELLVMNEEIRKLTIASASATEIKAAAVLGGMIPLYLDAMDKVRQGVTSLDEALLTVWKD